MANENFRFTVAVGPEMEAEMEADLDWIKKEKYYKNTRSEMIRDLIQKGLEVTKAEMAKENNN